MRSERGLSAAPFSRRGLAVLIVLTVASLLASGFLLLRRGTGSGEVSADPDSFSRSAVGHRLWIEMLRRLGIPVGVSRRDTAANGGPASLIVVAEPHGPGNWLHQLDGIDVPGARILLVLPKRNPEPDLRRPEYVRRAELHPTLRAEVMLAVGGSAASVRQLGAAPRQWNAALPVPDPDLPSPQVMQRYHGERLIWCEDGVLLGRHALDHAELYVLADPDLIANHGLLRGDNAAIAAAIVAELRAPDRLVLYDETLHGHTQAPSVWHELGEFPLVLLPVQLLLLAAFVAWVAAGRFGAPVAPAPAIAPGKGYLIDNVAALLGHSHRSGTALHRYVQERLRRVAAQRHAPDGLHGRALVDWFFARFGARLAPDEAACLQAAAGPTPFAGGDRAAAQAAREVHRITEEILSGHR